MSGGDRVLVLESFSPEQYTIIVSRKVTFKSGAEEIEENLISKVDFLVKEPSGQNKLAMQLYKEAILLKWTKPKGDKRKAKDALLKYIEITAKYSNSVYAPLAMRVIGAMRFFEVGEGVEGNEAGLAIAKKIINLYPNSPFAFESLKNIPVFYANMHETNEEKIKGDIQTIIDKYPNEKIGKEAAKLLEDFNKGKSSYHRIMKMKHKSEFPKRDNK